jgi:hypothetical protein
MNGFWKKEWEEVLRNRWLLVIIGVIILLRIPSIFEPYWYGDEGVYLTIGQALSRGEVLYRDIHDNKPPLLYILAMISGSQPTTRVVLVVWTIIGVAVFWKFSKSLYGERTGLWLTGAFGVLTSIPFLEGNIANAENFFLVLTTAGMYLVYRLTKNPNNESRVLPFAAGMLFAAGSLFKVPAAFDGLAAGILVGWLVVARKKQRWVMIRNALYLLLGFITAWMGVAILEWAQGAESYFLKEALLQNIGYLSTWTQSGNPVLGAISPFKFGGRLIWAGVISLTLIVLKKWVSWATYLGGVWLVWAIFGATLSGRPYAHYFLQIVPSLLILVGTLTIKRKPIEVAVVGAGLVMVAAVFGLWQPWFYRTVPYYANFIGWVSGKIPEREYFGYFDPAIGGLYDLASYVSQVTSPKEKIFIWGDVPQVYALARRLPVGRYTNAYHVEDFDPTRKETTKALATNPPRIIIWMQNEQRPYPELAEMLAHHYIKLKVIGGGTIYEKLDLPGSLYSF